MHSLVLVPKRSLHWRWQLANTRTRTRTRERPRGLTAHGRADAPAIEWRCLGLDIS
jgi:hypothetical protein